MKMLLVLAPTLGLAANVIAHLAVTWSLRVRSVYVRLACGAAVGLAACVATTLVASSRSGLADHDATAYVIFNAVTFLILAFGYFNLVQMNLSSVRLRIANELSDAADGVPAERLVALYDGRSIVDARLARLSRGGQIVLRDGRYYHRPSLVYLIAVAMDTMKRLVFRRRIRDGFATRPPDRPGPGVPSSATHART